MTFVVVATDRVSEEGLAPLQEDDRFEVRRIDDSGTGEFADALAEAHGLVVRSATRVDGGMIDRAPRLRVIGRAGVGVDNIDITAASRRGIAVFNAPGANTTAAAELTMALMLALVRRVTAADRSVRAGEWDRSRFQGVELHGRTLGIIGGGRIGGEVALRCRAFGMDVIVHDPYLPMTRVEELGVGLVELDGVLERADVISLHVPLNDETRHLVDAGTLNKMKRKPFLINVSRGGVIVEGDLVDALQQGILAGAALDVYESEPLAADSPLRDAPNLVLTPHLGAATQEAQIRVASETADAIKGALLEDDLAGALNGSELV